MDILIIILGIISLGIGMIPLLGIIVLIPAIVNAVIGGIKLSKEPKNMKIVIGWIASMLSIYLTIIYIVLFFCDLADLSLVVFFGSCLLVFILGMIICYKIATIRNLDKLKQEVVLQQPFFIRHIAGLDIGNDVLCTLSFTNLKIVINRIKDNKVLKVYNIKNEKVLEVEEDTIVEKQLASGDVIGNALLGGLIFGSVGAIVGATAGNTISSVKQDLDVIKIKYIDSKGEEKLILFSCEDKNSYNKFIKQYNKYILKKHNKKIESVEL